MKDMNVAAQNNISDLLKLARKFNCFYLAGMSTLSVLSFLWLSSQIGNPFDDLFVI